MTRFLSPRRSVLATLAAAACALPLAAQSPAPAPRPPEPPTYTFQILLLVAETQGAGGLEGIPANAHAALRDIQNFLPYRSYRLLDAAFLRTARSSRAILSALAGKTYDVSFTVRGVAEGPGKRLLVESFAVREVPVEPRYDAEITTPEAKITPRPPRGSSEILSTSFGMAVGETVVVGTSKLDGPTKALVVLLSAIP